jgi:hypothetical protein
VTGIAEARIIASVHVFLSMVLWNQINKLGGNPQR